MSKNHLSVLPLFPIYLLWNVPFLFSGFVVQRNVLFEMVVLQVGVLAFFSLLAVYRRKMGRLYLVLSIASVAFAAIFAISNEVRFSLIFLGSFIIAARYFLLMREKNDLVTGSAASAILVLLMVLSTSLRFVHLSAILPSPGFVYSIYNNASPAGIPLTYAYGLVYAIGPFALTVSPITIFLFPLIAYFTADNTFLIIDAYRSHGVTSLSAIFVTAIACQCENTIGIISGTVSSLALSVLPYFIFISVGLLILTNAYLHRPRKLKIPQLNKVAILVMLVSILAVEFAIVYTGIIYDLGVFGFNSFLTLISGFLIGQMVGVRWRLPIHFVLLAFVIQVLLFIPSLIRAALVSPTVFEVYSLAGLAAGFLISLSYRNRNGTSRIGIFEFVFSMESMIAGILLYLALFSVSFFSGYSELAVIDFSVFILVVSLPAMWFSNLYLLSARSFGS